MLWDTAGQEEFDAITKAYYRGETTVASLCEDADMPGVAGTHRFHSSVAGLHSRSPGMCAGLLDHRQGVISGHRQLEGEGGGRSRRYSYSSGAEQN